MSQDPKDQINEKPTTSGTRPVKKEVELFPVNADRPSLRSDVPTGGGNRLGTQISIFNPSTFEEALEIVETLRGRAATTISLDNMRKTDANRLIDFVSGASAALDGDFHKLTEMVYFFSPSNIKIVQVVPPTPVKGSSGAFDFLFSPELMADKNPAANPGSRRS
jgi:FtsZ-interacting cell division protein YlmF